MKTITINLYSFAELSEKSKEFALNEHFNFLCSVDEDEPTKEEVIENIEINDYLFFSDGNIAHVVTYTGKHLKAGQSEFYFHGETISI